MPKKDNAVVREITPKRMRLAGVSEWYIPRVALVDQAETEIGVDFVDLARALDFQLNVDFFRYWQSPARIVTSTRGVPSGCWGIVFVDDPTVANAFGYHEYTAEGLPISYVFVRLLRENGESVVETASHELLEMMINPGIHTCVEQDVNGYSKFYAKEVCDPVQGTNYEVSGFPGVRLSNFVLPPYFDGFRKPKSVPFDFLNRVQRPFQVLPGGYIPVFQNGGWTQEFGTMKASRSFDRSAHSRVNRLTAEKVEWRLSRPTTKV